MGLCGIEPQTSRLSAARSNHLSERPRCQGERTSGRTLTIEGVDGPPDRQSRDTHSGFPPAADRPTSREREILLIPAGTLRPRPAAGHELIFAAGEQQLLPN